MAAIKFFPYGHRALKNLFSKPVTKNYPAEPARFPERMRGHIEIKIEDCIGCGLCTTRCEFDAIHLNRELPECSRMVRSEDKFKAILPYMIKREMKIRFGKKDG